MVQTALSFSHTCWKSVRLSQPTNLALKYIPSEGYLLDEEEHDVVCDYEGDLVAEVSRSTTSAEQVIKQPFKLIKVSDNGDDTEAGLLAGAEFTAYLKSSLSVKADGSYDFDKATPVVIGENGATTIKIGRAHV